MPDFRKSRSAHPKKPGSIPPAKPEFGNDDKNPLEQLLAEMPRERLNPVNRLVFDANLCLNSYLDALKASSGSSGKPQMENANAKGIGAT